MEIVARQEDESPKQRSYRTAQFKLTTVCPKGLNHKEQEYLVSLMLCLTSFFSLYLKFTHSFCSTQIYWLPMLQHAGIVWTGVGEDTTTEACHHPGKLRPPVYTACDATQPHCAAMAECRLPVTFLTPSYFLATVFPLPCFCSLFQP